MARHVFYGILEMNNIASMMAMLIYNHCTMLSQGHTNTMHTHVCIEWSSFNFLLPNKLTRLFCQPRVIVEDTCPRSHVVVWNLRPHGLEACFVITKLHLHMCACVCVKMKIRIYDNYFNTEVTNAPL